MSDINTVCAKIQASNEEELNSIDHGFWYQANLNLQGYNQKHQENYRECEREISLNQTQALD